MRNAWRIILLAGALTAFLFCHAEELTWSPLTLTDTPRAFDFTVAANGVYAFYAFPQTDETFAEAVLYCDGEPLAAGFGETRLLEARLSVESTYTLTLNGTGTVYAEIARETLSRCFAEPIELTGEMSYEKLLARSGDAHWYALTPDSGGYALIAGLPEDRELTINAMLLDESGRILSRGMPVAGAFALDAEFVSGETVYLRVSARQGGTGAYRLRTLRDDSLPSRLSFPETRVTLRGRERVPLPMICDSDLCVAVSLNNDIAFVRNGQIVGSHPGETVLCAYACGRFTSACIVTVEEVETTDVNVPRHEVTMEIGEVFPLNAKALPENASDPTIRYSSGNSSVASVDEHGIVTAQSYGVTFIRAETADGRAATHCLVVVKPRLPKLRALLIGESNYADPSVSNRPGTENAVSTVQSLFEQNTYRGSSCETTPMFDLSRDETLAAIRATFADAGEDDCSVVYLTCHSFSLSGETYMLMSDGSVLTAEELCSELERIAGEVVLLLDSCASGGVTGATATGEDILLGATCADPDPRMGGAFAHSRVHVVASAYRSEDSYRITGLDGMCTVFAYALQTTCVSGETLNEWIANAAELGQAIVSDSGAYAQHITLSHEGDPLILFDETPKEIIYE